MEEPKPMLTLSQVMAKLAKDKNVTREFCMNAQGEMLLKDSEHQYTPEELKILKSYRFEGMSDPSDNAVLYLLEDKDGNKGYMIDSYGADSNYPGDKFDEFVRSIPVEEDDEYDFDK
ncbi:hypothetical protein IMZ16_06385 [Cruoricaptor ignavus]|uniref:Uncharacterized protein n=1 Tax=Cruoricaptor ignavus TaxID=1118202 RepID=A0A7M1T1M4_9FLAO|nr:hypothetical protein [Cruoricaptor ignavus]QOR73167.1 hypothetical protein IMZ16_06385 [Cruoricaptor ignavus]